MACATEGRLPAFAEQWESAGTRNAESLPIAANSNFCRRENGRPSNRPLGMNLLSSFGLAASSTLCAALVACGTTEDPAASTVVRTPAPRNHEKTITSYLAFKIRPQKNAEINI